MRGTLGSVEINLNGTNRSIITDLKNGGAYDLGNGFSIEFKREALGFKPCINNQSENPIIINKITVTVTKFNLANYSNYIINSLEPMESVKVVEAFYDKKKALKSQLFTVLCDEEGHRYNLIGFGASLKSNNYIEYSKADKEGIANAVYDFIAMELKVGESLALDSIYIDEDNNFISLFNNYIDYINFVNETNNDFGNRNISYKTKKNTENLFLESSKQDFTLTKKGKSLKIRQGLGFKYLVDISTEAGKQRIFDKIEKLYKDSKYIPMTNILQYINTITKEEVLNVFYYINELLIEIENKYNDKIIVLNDCPEGLLPGKNIAMAVDLKAILKNHVKNKKKKKGGILKGGTNYNFFIKVLTLKLSHKHIIKHSLQKDRLQQLIDIMTVNLGGGSIKYGQLIDIKDDINYKKVIPCIAKEDVFGLMVQGNRGVYIAMFNLSAKPTKFYWDFSTVVENLSLDGTAKEIFSDRDVLISNNSVYIKKISSMDCCLVKKSLNIC